MSLTIVHHPQSLQDQKHVKFPAFVSPLLLQQFEEFVAFESPIPHQFDYLCGPSILLANQYKCHQVQ